MHLRAQGTDAAGSTETERLTGIESRLSAVERNLGEVSSGGLGIFLCGAFCALWAQNTRREPWRWFLLGVLFNFIAVIVLLVKNSRDLAASRPPDSDST